MRNHRKFFTGIGILVFGALLMIAADHIDAPAVQGGTSDITDYFAFQGADNDNVVFVASVQGLLSPSATANASFDPNVMVEFNIDTDGDYIEDLVIQAIPRNKQMYFFGPYEPTSTGLVSNISDAAPANKVKITEYNEEANIEQRDGMRFFAGPRDDPFFFDFGQYSQIIAGQASGFNDPGDDTFAGTNVMSIVVEVPKSMVGGSGMVNTWVESKRRQ